MEEFLSSLSFFGALGVALILFFAFIGFVGTIQYIFRPVFKKSGDRAKENISNNIKEVSDSLTEISKEVETANWFQLKKLSSKTEAIKRKAKK